MNITIAGIGAVGGYFGGLLAKHFEGNENVSINFIARGEHLKEIQNHGLKILKGENEIIARPALATDKPSEIGISDFVIVATKSYDLESMIEQMRPCIDQHTIILPLLNGVDSRERIKKLLPNNIVLDGCVYIVSRLKQAGIIENIGNIETLYFGLDNVMTDKLVLLERLFKEANVQATLSQNISTILWEKFIFISPTATATSYFDNTIGELIADPSKIETVTALIEEVKQIAKAKQIVIPYDITEKSLNKLSGMPFAATSSMHSDFQKNKPNTELESLTGYVVNEAKRYHLVMPTYESMYAELKSR